MDAFQTDGSGYLAIQNTPATDLLPLLRAGRVI
jgi:hypothetical protein